jgi:hypothetical protein
VDAEPHGKHEGADKCDGPGRRDAEHPGPQQKQRGTGAEPACAQRRRGHHTRHEDANQRARAVRREDEAHRARVDVECALQARQQRPVKRLNRAEKRENGNPGGSDQVSTRQSVGMDKASMRARNKRSSAMRRRRLTSRPMFICINANCSRSRS